MDRKSLHFSFTSRLEKWDRDILQSWFCSERCSRLYSRECQCKRVICRNQYRTLSWRPTVLGRTGIEETICGEQIADESLSSQQFSSHVRVLASSEKVVIYSSMDPMCPCVDHCSNTGYIGSIKDEVMCGWPLSSQNIVKIIQDEIGTAYAW